MPEAGYFKGGILKESLIAAGYLKDSISKTFPLVAGYLKGGILSHLLMRRFF